eukprot:6201874-Pleurochrysis_carterae.AAC.3
MSAPCAKLVGLALNFWRNDCAAIAALNEGLFPETLADASAPIAGLAAMEAFQLVFVEAARAGEILLAAEAGLLRSS